MARDRNMYRVLYFTWVIMVNILLRIKWPKAVHYLFYFFFSFLYNIYIDYLGLHAMISNHTHLPVLPGLPLMIPLKKKKTKKQIIPSWDTHTHQSMLKLPVVSPQRKLSLSPPIPLSEAIHHGEPHLRIPITIFKSFFNGFLSRLLHLLGGVRLGEGLYHHFPPSQLYICSHQYHTKVAFLPFTPSKSRPWTTNGFWWHFDPQTSTWSPVSAHTSYLSMVSSVSADQPQSLIWPTCNPVSNRESGIFFFLAKEYIWKNVSICEANTLSLIYFKSI